MLSRTAAVFAAAGIVLASPLAAAAAPMTDPVDLGGAYVYDSTGVVGTDSAAVIAALDELYESTRSQLFVVIVDRFTGAADDQSWVDTSAELSGLGDADALLAIAVDDRTFRWSVSESYPLSDAALDEIAQERLVPELRQDRWATGIIGFAEGLSESMSDGPSLLLPVLGGVAALGIGTAVVVAVRRRRRGAELAPGEQSQAQLDRTAGSLLVELDDALRESEEELGFAEAQFGAAATAEFRAALESARDQVRQAFAIRQRLDDADAETSEERRALTLELIELCTAADAALDTHADAFEQLRDLEANAQAMLADLTNAQGALPGRLATAATTRDRLGERYGTEAIASIAGAVEQARELESFAAASLGSAREQLAAGQSSEAALSVRAAQQSIAQAEQLALSVETLDAELPKAVERRDAAAADLRADLGEAAALRTSAAGAVDAPALAAAIATAEAALAGLGDQDPAGALAALDSADAGLATTLTAVRERQERQARARQQLARTRETALDQISSAHSFISTRRGGVGAAARTRVAEAERRLARAAALEKDDAEAALEEARLAADNAREALRLARADVAGFASSTGSRAAPDLGAALLGGLLGGSLSGSSRGGRSGSIRGGARGGFGGASRRSSSPSSRRSAPRARRSGRRGGGGRF